MLTRIGPIANICTVVRCKLESVCTPRTFGNARGYLPGDFLVFGRPLCSDAFIGGRCSGWRISPGPKEQSNHMKQYSFDAECATSPGNRETSVGTFSGMAANLRLTIMAATGLFHGCVCLAAETNALAGPPRWLTQPMSMADAVSHALQHNGAILEGSSDLEAAHGLVVQTRAIALPKLRGTSGYTHNEAVEKFPFSGSETFIPLRDEWAGNIRVVQSIYEGGRIRSALRSARLIRDQAVLEYQTVIADTLLDVRRAYYDVLLAQQQIVVQEAAVKLLMEEMQNTIRRFETGMVPRFDVLRAEVEVANARPKLIRAENAHRTAKNNLATLLGYNIPATVAEDIPIILTDKLEAEPYNVDLATAIAQSMERRSELGALRKKAALRKEEIASAKAAYRPVVGIFGGYGARNSRFRNDFFSDLAGPMAGVELNWDIYDGSLTRGKVIQAKALYEKAGVNLDDAMRRVQFEVRTAYSGFNEAREVLESQKKVQEQAEEALRLAIARYDAGTGTQLDVLNAQTSLTEARTTQIQALHDYMVARARLQHAIGQDVPQPLAK